MKLTVCAAIVLIMVAGLSFWGCSENPTNPQLEYPFSNPNDFTTTALQTNILQAQIDGDKMRLYLSVTDQHGSPLESLNVHNFDVERIIGSNADYVRCGSITITTIGETETPISVAFTMDYSGSMPEDAITNMENGIKSFISLMGASDKCEIIKFAAGVHLEQTFTSNKDSLNAAVDRLYSYGDNGATNLFGSMHQGLNDLDSQTGMKALIAFTDGGENVYEYSQSQIISEAQSGGMPIYNIGLGDADASTLQYLADETGGRYFYAPTSEDLVNIYNMISGQLRGTYIFTWEGVYAPGYITSGTHVTLRVTTEYECGNGTIIDTTHNSYIAE